MIPLRCAKEEANNLSGEKSQVLQGTLDLMILKTLHALSPQQGWIVAKWGVSENKRISGVIALILQLEAEG